MSRITITSAKQRYRALKQASVMQGKAVSQLIGACLDFHSIRGEQDVSSLVLRARASAGLNETQALKRAMAETRAVRHARPGIFSHAKE